MKYLLSIYLTLCWLSSYPQSFDLSVAITGLKSTDGGIQIGLYNNKELFPHVDGQYKLYYFKADGFSGIYTISDLPEDEYAVAIFHDQNSDRICNTNFLGIPREGYGFSKNFKPRLSVPDFNDCKIDLKSNMSITINLIYR